MHLHPSLLAWRCRQSLEELVLDADGSLRVLRIENLVRQSNKSAAYGSSQLWLLAEWVLSDQGYAVRTPLAREFVRLLDVAVAGDIFSAAIAWQRRKGVQLTAWTDPCG